MSPWISLERQCFWWWIISLTLSRRSVPTNRDLQKCWSNNWSRSWNCKQWQTHSRAKNSLGFKLVKLRPQQNECHIWPDDLHIYIVAVCCLKTSGLNPRSRYGLWLLTQSRNMCINYIKMYPLTSFKISLGYCCYIGSCKLGKRVNDWCEGLSQVLPTTWHIQL